MDSHKPPLPLQRARDSENEDVHARALSSEEPVDCSTALAYLDISSYSELLGSSTLAIRLGVELEIYSMFLEQHDHIEFLWIASYSVRCGGLEAPELRERTLRSHEEV